MSMYKDYRAVKQPEVHRTWTEALQRQRVQLIVLLAVFVVGLVVVLAAPFAGSLLAGSLVMIAGAVSLLGTVVGGRYFD